MDAGIEANEDWYSILYSMVSSLFVICVFLLEVWMDISCNDLDIAKYVRGDRRRFSVSFLNRISFFGHRYLVTAKQMIPTIKTHKY